MGGAGRLAQERALGVHQGKNQRHHLTWHGTREGLRPPVLAGTDTGTELVLDSPGTQDGPALSSWGGVRPMGFQKTQAGVVWRSSQPWAVGGLAHYPLCKRS